MNNKLFQPSYVVQISFPEFPTAPTGPLKRFIADEADAQLARYLPIPADTPPPPPGVEIPPRPQLPEGVVDAPLIRVFNFLRTSFLLLICDVLLKLG